MPRAKRWFAIVDDETGALVNVATGRPPAIILIEKGYVVVELEREPNLKAEPWDSASRSFPPAAEGS